MAKSLQGPEEKYDSNPEILASEIAYVAANRSVPVTGLVGIGPPSWDGGLVSVGC